MKNSKKKILIPVAIILCIILIAVSVYFLFFRNSTPSDENLLGVFIPESSQSENPDVTSIPFVSSMTVFELNEDEKAKADADVLSNDNWMKYIDSEYNVKEKFNTVLFTSDIDPDLENCYLAIYDYGENMPDLPLSVHPEPGEDVITFASYLLAVYDSTNGIYYYIESIL